jgi:hypothetical protein
MRKIVLLGHKESKRTDFFLKAAEELKQEIEFCDIGAIDENKLIGKLVKIDPNIYESFEVEKLNNRVLDYINNINHIQSLPNIKFLNTPQSISDVLSKKHCKKVLLQNNINTTSFLNFNIKDYTQLKEAMYANKIYAVFIKPNYGSGAAGVIAYRYNPVLCKEVMYTSLTAELSNTKRIKKYEDKHDIKNIIDKILNSNTIIERWMPKSTYLDYIYDLRVVVQFGKVDFIVCRLSKNPITNLHLNNNALNIKELNLKEEKLEEINNLCIKAVSMFSNLKVAGVDILLTKNELKPYIIEINGQGDLIYQDVYNKNIIYKNQISELKKFHMVCLRKMNR